MKKRCNLIAICSVNMLVVGSRKYLNNLTPWLALFHSSHRDCEHHSVCIVHPVVVSAYKLSCLTDIHQP